MRHIKDWLLNLVTGAIAVAVSAWLDSSFLEGFLSSGLITLLVALLAINTTTVGLVASKVKDLADKHGYDFEISIRAMRHSVTEQIVLLIVATVVSVIKDSTVIGGMLPYHDAIWTTVLAAIAIGAVQVLADTASGIFVVLNQKNT